MNILFTICGRAGSKGVKNKNIRDFLGHPLPLYTLSSIELYIKDNPQDNCHIVLNTDSAELIEIIKKGSTCKVDIILRDEVLGKDDTPKIDVIASSLEEMDRRNNIEYDIVVDLDITSPLRTVEDIKAVIDKKKNTDADIVFTVTESRRNPYFNMVMETESGYERVIKSNFKTRQEAPKIYDMNASIYAYEPGFLKTRKMIFDGKCDIVEMMDTGILDIDSEKDFELMEVIAEYLFLQHPNFAKIFMNFITYTNDK